jgi:hypothetical protein
MHIMKNAVVLLISGLALMGCATNYFVSTPDQYAEVTARGQGSTATIMVRQDSSAKEYIGEEIVVNTDSTHWKDQNKGETISAPTSHIRSVQFTSRGVSTLVGLGIGAAPGMTLFLLVQGTHDNGGVAAGVSTLGLASGIAGGAVGAGIGALVGHTTQYVFPDGVDEFNAAHLVTARNVIYFEFASMILGGSLSLNYERLVAPDLWLRFGYGVGAISGIDNDYGWGQGPLLMGLFLPGRNSKFELGLGGSFMYGNLKAFQRNSSRNYISQADWWFIPAASIGYRYQPSDGGLLFRIGLTYVYYGGFPLQISFGYAF